MLPSETQFHPLQESTLRFDGGAMFGHVPKTVWQKLVEPDHNNRVLTACNSLLVRTAGKNIVVEVGMGTKWSDKEVELYELKSNPYSQLLSPHGLTTSDIDLIIVTHLHIDHAGGLTRFNGQQKVESTFPNATVVVQQGEWEAANNPDLRSRPSYRAHDFLPIHESGKLQLVQGSRQILPGVEVILTGGHTQWHQIVKFTTARHTVYYLGDCIPSTAHLKPHWVMGYDLYPMDVIRARSRLFPLLVRENVIVVFGHDPANPVARIVEGKKPNTFDFLPAKFS
ncbi:MBL fold metallo-hydrolase [Candidatus Sumerlaeota bacterium]|nr:MBL fold metallo-hydrolase [Candidatus Sumerlaeota bacterium]